MYCTRPAPIHAVHNVAEADGDSMSGGYVGCPVRTYSVQYSTRICFLDAPLDVDISFVGL